MTNPMTEAEMLANLEAIGAVLFEYMTNEQEDQYSAVIQALRVRVDAEKADSCPVCNSYNLSWREDAERYGVRCISCDSVSPWINKHDVLKAVCIPLIVKDKDHA